MMNSLTLSLLILSLPILSLASLMLQHKYIIFLLLSLEMVSLTTLSLMIMLVTSWESSGHFFTPAIVMMACEGALGLSVLMILSHKYSSSFISMAMNMLW